MSTDISPSAAISVVVFLGSAVALLALLGALTVSLVKRNRRALRVSLIGVGTVVLLYAGTALALSLASEERVLGRTEEKHLCEIDCHLAYSVDSVEPFEPDRRYTVVTLRVRFDETTIGPNRGNGPLTPNRRRVVVLDGKGNAYERSPEGEAAVRTGRPAAGSLADPLRPGQSIQVPLVFELPEGIESPRLFVTGAGWETRLLIGHENSPLHGKTAFRL